MTNCIGFPSSVSNLIFVGAVVCAVSDMLVSRSAATTGKPMRRFMFIKNPPWVCSRLLLRRAFIQLIQRPFCDGQGIEYRLAKIGTAQRIESRIGSRPNDVAVPFDKYIVDGAIVTAEFVQVPALWRNEVGHFFGAIKIADVVAAQPGDEIGIRNKILARFTGCLQMRGIVRAEAPALETEIAVWSLRRRDWARKLCYRDRMLFVANIDNPVGKKNLIAIGVGGFSVGQHKSAVENPAINGVKRNSHRGILRGRLEAAHFPLFFRIAQIKNDETVTAERPVPTVAAVFQFFGGGDWT